MHFHGGVGLSDITNRALWRFTVRLMFGRGVEGDVDDGFELDGDALFGGGAELPLTESVHGVGVQLLVDASDELDALDRAVTAGSGLEVAFPFPLLIDHYRRGHPVDLY